VLIGSEPEDYAAHILRLLDDAGERERIAANGQRFVRERFDWERAAHALDTLITTPAAAHA
jgi:glycosyltransferase involved in cell wall biosynthesis